MDIPLDAIKTFIGGLVIENLALQHRVAELETVRSESVEPPTEHVKRMPFKSMSSDKGA
jgi:hypothetical protein